MRPLRGRDVEDRKAIPGHPNCRLTVRRLPHGKVFKLSPSVKAIAEEEGCLGEIWARYIISSCYLLRKLIPTGGMEHVSRGRGTVFSCYIVRDGGTHATKTRFIRSRIIPSFEIRVRLFREIS